MSENDEIARMLADQLERLLTDRAGDHLAAEPGAANALCADVEELGLRFACVPEAGGGAGLDPVQVFDALMLLGYHAAPAGIGEAMLAEWLLAQSGLEMNEGPVLLGSGELVMDGAGVSGSVKALALPDAERVIASVRNDGVARIVRFDLAQARVTQTTTGIAREASLEISVTGVVPHASCPAPVVSPDMALAALRSAQIAGALARSHDLCIDYANTREQFGRPIAKFQAIQHLVADLACEAAAAQVGARIALGGLTGTHPLEAVAAGKIRGAMAARKGALLAHQLHGAIGVTREYVLHQFTRRLWQWRDDAGSEHHWSDRLGAAVLDRGQPWQDIIDITNQRPAA